MAEPRLFLCALLVLVIFCVCRGNFAAGDLPVPWEEKHALLEEFDSAQPSWEMLYIDPGGMFSDRARVSDTVVSGKSETCQCDFVSHGIYFVGHHVLLPYLIEDLNAGIWVRSEETGIICAFEVVLPKSTAKDGKPVTLLLPGTRYTHRGEWQQLRVKTDLRQLEQQAKMLRLELGVPIDTSQAYVRRLVLCCYVSGKTSRIWLDRLHADGIATVSRDVRERCEAEAVFNPKNVLWLYREIGLYRDMTLGLGAHVEPTAVAGENWTLSRETTPQSTLGRHAPSAQRLVPPDVLEQTREFQQRYSQAGFRTATNSQTLLIPDSPILMVSANDNPHAGWSRTAEYHENRIPTIAPGDRIVNAADPSAAFYPNGTDAQTTSQPQYAANDSITGSGRTMISPASYEQGVSSGSFSSSPLSSRLSEQPELYRRADEGEFPDHVLQDRVNRGKPHDGCRITAQRETLYINGNLPYAIRAVEYRGEPLSFLAGLQFNTIWLRHPPSEALLEEAWKLGLWVICPPPDRENLQRFVEFLNTTGMTEAGTARANGGSLGIMGRMFARNRNPILAWDIGRTPTLAESGRVQQDIQLLRQADMYRDVPLICSTESGTRDYSRIVDIVLLDRNPILSSLELRDYGAWLAVKVAWARAGTPNWCTIQTQPTAAMANQWRLFGVDEIPPTAVSEEHVRIQIRMAMAAGCHGLFFTSNSRLDADNAETKYRAALLELVNMELMLVEGWLGASGSTQTVKSSVGEITGILLTTDRAKLLLPNIAKPFGQYVMGNTNCNDVDFLMPGNFETHQANHLIPGGTRPLTLQRVTGGVHVHFDEVNTTTAAFFAQADPILRAIIPRARQPELSRRSARLAIELAKMRLEQVRKTIRVFQEIQASPEGLPFLPGDGFPIISMPEQESMLRETERSINTAESYFRQSDFSSAYQQAHRSIAGLQYYERLKWEEAIRNVPHHNMVPTSVSFVTLPAYIQMLKKMYRMKPGENRLVGGDGENAAQWQQAGWRSFRLPTDGVTPVVTVANSRAARSGSGGIQLRLLPTSQIASTVPTVDGTASTTLISGTESAGDVIQIETAPVWITTPQIPVYAGEILCITGYVNIPQKLQGNVDGLMIFDSLGGEPLALRMSETNGQWRQFVCYRAVPTVVPPQASMCVTFALNGLGEVLLDDLQIFPIIPDPDAFSAPPQTPSSGSGWPQLQLPRIPGITK